MITSVSELTVRSVVEISILIWKWHEEAPLEYADGFHGWASNGGDIPDMFMECPFCAYADSHTVGIKNICECCLLSTLPIFTGNCGNSEAFRRWESAMSFGNEELARSCAKDIRIQLEDILLRMVTD